MATHLKSIAVNFKFETALLPLVDQLARQRGFASRGSLLRGWLHGELAQHWPGETEKVLSRRRGRVLSRHYGKRSRSSHAQGRNGRG